MAAIIPDPTCLPGSRWASIVRTLGRASAERPPTEAFDVRSARFRLASRVFAILLLAWTTADLCGHGMCVHDREPLVPGAPAAPGQPATV